MSSLLLLIPLSSCAAAPDAADLTQAAAADPGYEPPPAGAPDWAGVRWTGAVIPYVIDKTGTYPDADDPNTQACGKGKAMSDAQTAAIQRAIAEWNALGPVKLVQYTVEDPPPAGRSFLIYRNRDGDSSATTVRGMPRDGVSPNCVTVQSTVKGETTADDVQARRFMLHETGHALGFDHEQQRSDRDEFVDFDGTCADTGDMEKIFDIDDRALLLSPYDVDSIMQYASNNSCGDVVPGCKDDDGKCLKPIMLYIGDPVGCPESEWKDPPEKDCRDIDAPKQLSVHDVNALYRMYDAERPFGHGHAGDQLGQALAVGDFDEDGYLDLAVGAPGNSPHVVLWKGTAGSRPGSLGRLVRWKILRPADAGVLATAISHDGFGAALAVGDFNGDGADDLAVGAPGPDGGADSDGAGSVYVYMSTKVTDSPRRTIVYDHFLSMSWIFASPTEMGPQGARGDFFGAALAAGDFAGDGKDDLVIGIPRRVVGGVRSGEVLVVPDAQASKVATELRPDAAPGGALLAGARFGATLLVANLNPDAGPSPDILVGSPEPATASPSSGKVYIFGGGTLAGREILRPASGTVAMHFGEALAVGDFDFDPLTPGGHVPVEIAVGAPHRPATVDGVSVPEAGAVFVFKHTTRGTLQFVQAARIDEQPELGGPGAGNHFGAALAARPGLQSAADFLGFGHHLIVGVPGFFATGAVEEFRLLVLNGGAPPQSAVSLGARSATTAGDHFGAALAVGSFLPMPDSPEQSPGTFEVVAGAPGYGAGVFAVHNYDETIAWRVFSQESAVAE